MDSTRIVTFANQKGGVGKTTLCVAFANYLVAAGMRVLVVDCDAQQSVAKNREHELTKYNPSDVPYEIRTITLGKTEPLKDLIRDISKEENVDVAIFDAPGAFEHNGLPIILACSDVIVVPYHYDQSTMITTTIFIGRIRALSDMMKGQMKAQLFFVPNRQNLRVGTKEEKEFWEKKAEDYRQFGTVTPMITDRVDMQRVSTLADMDRQKKIVQPSFDIIFNSLYQDGDT